MTGLLSLGLWAFGGALHAQPPAPGGPPAATAEADALAELLQASGLNTMLKQLPEQVRLGMSQAAAQGGPTPPPQAAAALGEAADEVFAFDRLEPMARALLEQSLSPEQLSNWLAFYRTPLGQKVAQADARASAPGFVATLVERAPQQMEQLSRDTPRMALLQSWLQATDAVAQATQMAIQTQLAVAWGLLVTTQPAGERPSFVELQAFFEGQRFAIRAQMAQLVLVHTALAYEALSQDELSQLLAQANSPAGQALFKGFSPKLQQTLAGLSEQLGQAAGRRLAQKPV